MKYIAYLKHGTVVEGTCTAEEKEEALTVMQQATIEDRSFVLVFGDTMISGSTAQALAFVEA